MLLNPFRSISNERYLETHHYYPSYKNVEIQHHLATTNYDSSQYMTSVLLSLTSRLINMRHRPCHPLINLNLESQVDSLNQMSSTSHIDSFGHDHVLSGLTLSRISMSLPSYRRDRSHVHHSHPSA